MNRPRDDPEARLSLSWRSLGLGSLVLAVGLFVALIVVATISDAGALATVALVLALVAFAAQLTIFLAQTLVAARQIEQVERINTQTSTNLGEMSSQLSRLDVSHQEMRQYLLPAATSEKWMDLIFKAQYAAGTGADAELQGILSDLLRDIEATETQSATESVSCVRCALPMTVSIGSKIGDSGVGRCGNCLAQFHVNRRREGVTTSPMGTPSTNAPRRRPTELLGKGRMVLPDPATRAEIVSAFVERWMEGAILTADDVTSWIDEPSTVTTPFFFAMVRDAYGPVTIERDRNSMMRDWSVLPPNADSSERDLQDEAHAAWIAQAIYRLKSWKRDEAEELEFFFGADPTQEEREIMNLARRKFEQEEAMVDS